MPFVNANVRLCMWKVQLCVIKICRPLGERTDRPSGSSGREDQRLGEFSGGTQAEAGFHRRDAATGNTHIHTRIKNQAK